MKVPGSGCSTLIHKSTFERGGSRSGTNCACVSPALFSPPPPPSVWLGFHTCFGG